MKKLLTLALALLLVCSIFVACGEDKPTVTYDLDGAVAYVEGLYKEDLSVTAVDYDVVAQVMIAGVTYQIDWSVDSDKVTVGEAANGVVTIGVDEKSPEEVSYKLTATVKAGDGTSATTAFKLSVPKYSVNSHEEYMAAVQDDMLTVEGIVVAINSKDAGNKYNHLFLADAEGKGGYYCYSVSQDPVKDLGIEVGMTVKVTGPMAPYSGMQEIKGGQVAIVDSTIKTVDAIDLTEKFAAGESLAAYVGMPVTFKGVTIGAQDLEKDTSQYLYFAIGEQKGYVRTYITDFPTTLKVEEKAAIDADHAAHFGYKADATGILILYNGAPYLIPMSATPFTNYEEIVITAEEKIASELEALKITTSFASDAEEALPAAGQYYDDVAITWAIDGTSANATIADGKLSVTIPDAEEIVKVVATITCGEASETKTFEVKLSKTVTSLKTIIEICADLTADTVEKYISAGIITEVRQDYYGNLIIVDESGEILVYGTFLDGDKYGDAAEKPVVGDYIVISGVLANYKGTPEFKNADITFFTAPTTIADAIAKGEAGDYSESCLVTGKVVEIQNEKYGNTVIEDANGNSILLYGLYDQRGVRFDAMEKKPAVGDTIAVYGPVGNYNGTAQLKNATIVAIFPAAAE